MAVFLHIHQLGWKKVHYTRGYTYLNLVSNTKKCSNSWFKIFCWVLITWQTFQPAFCCVLIWVLTVCSTLAPHHENAFIVLTLLNPHFYTIKLGFTGYTLIFLFLLKNTDCRYSLEPPRQGGSNEYPQSMFWAEIWKLPELFIWNLGVSLCN